MKIGPNTIALDITQLLAFITGRRSLAAALLLTVSACGGFTPLYQSGSGASSGLSSVQVADMPDRLGQQVRGYMIDKFRSNSAPLYDLQMNLETSTDGFGIRPDAASTQEEVTVVGRWELVDVSTGEAVLTGSERASETFDVVLSDFANLTQREDTERRLAYLIADEVHIALASWFVSQAQKAE